jgi:hypothetical protein
MRAFGFLNVAILSVLVAGSAALYAQDEKPQEEPKRQEEPREPKRDEMKAPKTKQDEAKPSKQDKQEQKQDEKQSREQMKTGEQKHGQPAGKSARIPEDKFRANFGRSHTFKVNRPVVVNGQPQIQYGGYSFVIVDAWPTEWVYTDDCYIDDIDGEYFLFDLFHPGVRIALMVVL